MQPETAQDPSGTTRSPGAESRRSGGSHGAARPVFLDPSGRRQRRVRRFGRLLAVPAAGYAALLLSTALGGPSVGSPYLPLPAPGDHGTGAATPRHAPPGPARRTPAATTGAASSAPPAAHPSAHPSASGSAAAATTATAKPSATASPTVTHGRSAATHPVPTHTGHGRG